MIASAMQLVQLICYGKRQGYNDKALTWRKNLLTFQLVLLDLMKFLYPIFLSRFPLALARPLASAYSRLLVLERLPTRNSRDSHYQRFLLGE